MKVSNAREIVEYQTLQEIVEYFYFFLIIPTYTVMYFNLIKSEP